MFLAFGCVAALVAASPADDADKVKKEFAALAGTWTVTAAEQDGESFDRIIGGVMVVKDRTFDIKTVSGSELSGDLVLDPTAKPKTWDYIHQKGPLAEKKWEGIYALDGDTLKICYAEADSENPRPDAFKTAAESKRLFLTLERKKK